MKQSGLAAVLLLISLALAQDGEWFTCLLVLVAWQVTSQSAIHVHMTTCTCTTMYVALQWRPAVLVQEMSLSLCGFALNSCISSCLMTS